MIGYPLDLFKNELTHVAEEHAEYPGRTVPFEKIFGATRMKRLKEYFGKIEIAEMIRRIPVEGYLKHFTFDQMAKLRYNQLFTMEKSVETLYEENPEYSIVRKIGNSMWRWGSGSGVWNEVVDAYNGIRNFKIPVDGFEVRLDFTTYCNPRGMSRESRTYLDGVFGFLVYYKGEHVMTLGFSVMAERRILVQQVQLTKRKGNRFLFRLPANRVEFFLQCFEAAFPHHTLCIVDGADVAQENIDSYKWSLGNVLDWMKSYKDEDRTDEKEYLEARIAHLTADVPRLTSLYAETGRFTRTGNFRVNGIRHYPLAA